MRRLALLIQRILDAEVLSEAEGSRLLTETDAALQALEAGDAEVARQHIKQVAFFTEALVQTDALTPVDGQAVIQVANGILDPKPDAGDPLR